MCVLVFHCCFPDISMLGWRMAICTSRLSFAREAASRQRQGFSRYLQPFPKARFHELFLRMFTLNKVFMP